MKLTLSNNIATKGEAIKTKSALSKRLGHFNRRFNEEHIDPKLSHLNVNYKGYEYAKDIDLEYDSLFKNDIELFNKGTSKSRQKDHFFNENGKQNLCKATILELGNRNDFKNIDWNNDTLREQMTSNLLKVMDEYLEVFDEELLTYSIHFDEPGAGPHLHLLSYKLEEKKTKRGSYKYSKGCSSLSKKEFKKKNDYLYNRVSGLELEFNDNDIWLKKGKQRETNERYSDIDRTTEQLKIDTKFEEMRIRTEYLNDMENLLKERVSANKQIVDKAKEIQNEIIGLNTLKDNLTTKVDTRDQNFVAGVKYACEELGATFKVGWDRKIQINGNKIDDKVYNCIPDITNEGVANACNIDFRTFNDNIFDNIDKQVDVVFKGKGYVKSEEYAKLHNDYQQLERQNKHLNVKLEEKEVENSKLRDIVDTIYDKVYTYLPVKIQNYLDSKLGKTNDIDQEQDYDYDYDM